ncbi:shikimate O-hydroxycinnamoyltransferase-like [Gossypium australe]|uniref:Shikimate O-hydroxycinnamoyltransferase-like n=1 Tax=Gossypium australe TaxID=47621 RepID=A0A5B6WG72_9ROSI|nr:shikimate O-hydroxycinnamoyltransferase-like [Gossypium australe]
MEIIMKESTIVRPADDIPKQRRLKEALSKILVPFYPIAGRLGYDENGRLEIICNAEEVLFVEAETTSVMEHLIGDFTENSQVFRLIPKVDYSGGVSSYPLLVLQVTKLKCGGVCLGVGFQHTLGDGIAALHFINSWADTSRSLSLAIVLFIDRTLLRPRDPPTPKFYHVEHDPSLVLKSASKSQSDDHKPSIVSTFKLTADQLNTLKAKANVANENSGKKHTTFNILAAHIWSCVSKARGPSVDQDTKLFFPVDGYFGNVTFRHARIAKAGDLEIESFTDTIKRIHEALNQTNDEYLRSPIDYIEIMSNLNNLVTGPHTFRCPNLYVIPWNWLPTYEADFGWGRPIYMRPGNVVQEGKMYIY